MENPNCIMSGNGHHPASRAAEARVHVDARVSALQEELRDAETRFAALVDDLPYAYFTADLTGTLISTNRAAEELTGYRAEERPNLQDVIVPEDLPRAMADLALVATEPNDGPREYRIRRKDGTLREIEINTVPLRRGQELVGFQGTARDVTEEKHAAAAVQESEGRFRELAEFLPGIVYEYDLTGRVTFSSKRALEATGYSQHDVDAGLSVLDLLTPEDHARAAATMQRMIRGEGPFRAEYDFVHRDGHRIPVEVHGAPIFRNGEVVGVRGLAHDLTPIRLAEAAKNRLERQMQRAQKLESLGVLAGGVAHDFNNLLQVILGNASLAIGRLEEASPLHPRLAAIHRATRHARDLCEQMLAYSGTGPVTVGPADLNDTVRQMLDLISASVPKSITIVEELATAPLWIEADRTQMQQVLMNLVTNAAEALGAGGGSITIRTGATQAEAADLASTPIDDELPAGEYATLEVIDTGVGMDEDTLQRVFDPFYSTKFAGRGLGLASALGIVRGHRGALQAETRVGEGTCFRVLLPRVPPPAEVTEDRQRPVVRTSGSGTILLVDDEADVRESTGMILESAGYSVISADGGHEAVAVFERGSQAVNAVILDLSMPGMGGLTTFQELRRLDPGVPIVLCSGYSEHDVAERFRGLDVDAFLKKPYELVDLLDTVHHVYEKDRAK